MFCGGIKVLSNEICCSMEVFCELDYGVLMTSNECRDVVDFSGESTKLKVVDRFVELDMFV